VTTPVVVDGIAVEIRDQQPLQEGHIAFSPGYTFLDLLAELNERVFLWPGDASDLVDRGRAHYQRYAAAGAVYVLRCPTQSLLRANSATTLYVSRCNSGAPRSNPRVGYAPRGPDTFRLLWQATFGPGEIKELSCRGFAILPTDTQWRLSTDPEAQWHPMWPVG